MFCSQLFGRITLGNWKFKVERLGQEGRDEGIAACQWKEDKRERDEDRG